MSPDERSPASRRARVGSMALGYLGISWIVLQVVDVVLGILTFPDWVVPGVLVLLLIGLVMVVATAWVQADPETTEREDAGEVPSDWQIAPADAFSALTKGRLPHLTWGRTLVAGVVALSLLFGVAGAYVLVTQGGFSRGQSQSGIAAGETADDIVRIAVLPFATSGEDLDVYEEGMVELLSTNLDGLGGIQAIDARTVLARWDELIGSTGRPDLEASLQAASATGASHALLGSVVSTGSDVRLTSQLHDLATGAQMSEVRQEGPADEMLGLVDGLSVAVARDVLGSEAAVSETGMRLASITTSSIPALELYLEAEAHYRRGQFTEAVPLLESAIQADPTFGLAVMRKAQAFGWLGVPGGVSSDSLEAARRAIRPLLDRLAPRDAVIAEGGIIDFADRDPNGLTLLREFVQRYPDEAEGWYQLSDFSYHLNDIRGGTRDEILDGFDRAVELGPRFAPYYIHAIDGALLRSDSARYRELVERYRGIGGEQSRLDAWQITEAVILGTDDAFLDDVAAADPARLASVMGSSVILMSTRPQRVADVARTYLDPGDPTALALLLRAGRWQQVADRASLDDDARRYLAELGLAWAGAFDMGSDAVSPITGPAEAQSRSDWWLPEAAVSEAVSSMLTARDQGTGADPLLLAHLAERAGEVDLAMRLYAEESWRYLGPAATFRLARLHDREGQQESALRLYREFLLSWSQADPDLPPVVEARAAVQRLTD